MLSLHNVQYNICVIGRSYSVLVCFVFMSAQEALIKFCDKMFLGPSVVEYMELHLKF